MVKNPSASAGDLRDVGLIPGSGRSPGGGHGSPLQYSCLENLMDRKKKKKKKFQDKYQNCNREYTGYWKAEAAKTSKITTRTTLNTTTQEVTA